MRSPPLDNKLTKSTTGVNTSPYHVRNENHQCRFSSYNSPNFQRQLH